MKLKTILEAVFPLEEELPACADHLAAYIETELAGGDAAQQFPELALCLKEQPAVQEAYAEMKLLLQMEQNNEFVAPPRQPNFDFGYLKRPFWQQTLSYGQQVRRLFTELVVKVQAETAVFATLPQALTLVPAATLRSKAPPVETLQAVALETDEDELVVHVIVGPVSDQKAQLTIQIQDKVHQEPLRHVRITLLDSQGRLLARKNTRDEGSVLFPNIAAGHYFVQVQAGQKVWELPLTFALG